MTIPDSADAPILLTDADVLARVQALVGRAITDHQLWIMFVDGDNRQAPVVGHDECGEPHSLDVIIAVDLDGLTGADIT